MHILKQVFENFHFYWISKLKVLILGRRAVLHAVEDGDPILELVEIRRFEASDRLPADQIN